MKISHITLHKVQIPMVKSFTTSFGTIKEKPTVIIKLRTNEGFTGWGEAAALPFPFYTPDTADICMLALKKYLCPLVLKREFKTINQLMNFMKPVVSHKFSKTAIESAVWTTLALKKKVSLSQVLGGRKKQIPINSSIGIDSLKNTLVTVSQKLKQGRHQIKLKIKPGWDIKIVEAVRKKFGNIRLMVDANSAYTLKDIKLLKKLDHYQLTMIEQPLGTDDIVDHSILQKQIKTPICLDESIFSAEDARKAIYLKACQIINIKPGRVGGLLESKKIHNLCQKHGIGVWCGGMLETSIGRAANIAVASLPNFKYPNDMSMPKSFYKDDLVKSSFTIDQKGYVQVPTATGLGFEVSQKKINKYTIEKVNIS